LEKSHGEWFANAGKEKKSSPATVNEENDKEGKKGLGSPTDVGKKPNLSR